MNKSEITALFNGWYGTEWETSNGVTAKQAYNFASFYFNTTSNNFSTNQWANYLSNGGYVLTVIDSGFGDGSTHAVTVTGYNADGTYSYYDATRNLTLTGTVNDFKTNIFSMGINGTCI